MEKQASSAFRFSPRPNRAGEIHWREWDDDTFRQAQAEDKPVLLAISAVWCHWCHVMDETTYSDQTVIDAVNRDYVPVRVDNDRRPDVNRRYNQGGWPTTAILTPSGELLWGATYMPPQAIATVLRQAKSYYRANKARIQAEVARGWQRQGQLKATDTTQADIGAQPASGEEIAQKVIDALRAEFDPVHGGFGTEPKFPQPAALQFALEHHHHNPDKGLSSLTKMTLDGMLAGGIFDKVEGGFFRYATKRDWSTPHYEKMLEDNVALLQLYVDARKVFGAERYQETAHGIAKYLLDTLYDGTNGVFFGSQDADEEYYALDVAQRLQRQAPLVDRTVYVDWNAKAASAYAEGYRVLGDARWRQITLRAVDFLWHRCFRPDLGMYHYWMEGPRQPGLLADQVSMLAALLDAHEISGNPAYLDQAEELSVLVRREFTADDGGFNDLAKHEVQRIGLLRVPDRPLDDNAAAADAYRRLSLMTGNEQYREIADETLRSFAGEAANLGLHGAKYAQAAERLRRAPVHVVVVGDRQHARTADLFFEGTRVFAPGKVTQLVEPHSNRLAALGYPASPSPVAYVCLNYTCLPPITNPDAIEPAINNR